MPHSKKDLKAIHSRALKRFKRAYEFEKDFREEMKEDLRFARGKREDQWPEEVLRERGNTRPALVINRMGAFERQVMGDIRQNTPAVKARPTEDGDKEVARIMNGLIRFIQNSSSAKQAYKTAATMAVRCGYGVFRIATEFTSDDVFEQDIKFKRVRNPFTVWFDPDAEELTKADGRFAFESETIDIDEFKAKWPNADPVNFDLISQDDRELWKDGTDKIRIANYWERATVDKHLALLEKGEVIDLDTVDPATRNTLPIKRTRTVKSHKVTMYRMNGMQIFDTQEFASKYIPLIPVYGDEHNVEGEVTYKGIVRDAKDPQRMYNYHRTTGIETTALQPRIPWLVTDKHIKGQEGKWRVANQANLPYLIYNPDPSAPPPKREQPPSLPTAFWQESEIAQQDMKATAGIFDAALGSQSNETSGKAIIARQRESDTGNYLFSDNLASAVEHAGRICIDLIPKIYDTERTIRILGEEEEEEVVKINQANSGFGVINDLTVGKYDVISTVGPSFNTKRMEAADNLMSLISSVPRVGEVAADLVVKNLDMPGGDVLQKRLEKTLPPGVLEPEEGSEEEQQQQEAAAQAKQLEDLIKQLQLQGMDAENDAKRAKAAKDMAAVTKELGEMAPLIEQMVAAQVESILQNLIGQQAQPEPINIDPGAPGQELIT